ncbi:zinc finger protein interacting with ribonucleoprotein K-like isoform X2 [Ambystoma mexicanum]|uniref:zinc finger protein interacting with ribonucleoprotein K-like isoform X2 n=1 Tax=Ambystoma mexicanum TaxID=8296 RepID=UPI0037E7EADD
MSQQHLLKGRVTFLDVAASFSEEEWKLLHEWQKELYENLMKEIHQILISLGPVIATSVFSLRAKEKENKSPVDNEHSEATLGVNHPTEYKDFTPVLLNIKQEGDTNYMEDADSGQTETISYHEGLGIVSTESETDVEAHIDEGEESSNVILPDDRSMSTRRKIGQPSNCNKSSESKSSAQKVKAKVVQNFVERTHSARPMSPIYDEEQREEKHILWQSGLQHTTYSNVHERTLNLLASDQFRNCEGVVGNVDMASPDSDTKQSWRPYKYPEMVKSFCPNGSQSGHQHVNSEKGQYTYTECEGNFSTASKMLKHQRTHTGNRPYSCNVCGKSFNSKGVLIRHQIIHTGERPYPCTICGKSFRQKEVLSRHLNIHTGEKPYECVVCGKTFSRKGTLVRHQTIHTKDRTFRFINYSKEDHTN